jgi:hypothetical protein
MRAASDGLTHRARSPPTSKTTRSAGITNTALQQDGQDLDGEALKRQPPPAFAHLPRAEVQLEHADYLDPIVISQHAKCRKAQSRVRAGRFGLLVHVEDDWP